MHTTKPEARNMGRNDMIVLHGVSITNGRERPIAILVDTGCSKSCMPRQSIRRLGLPTRRLKHSMTARIADGSTYEITFEAKLTFRIGNYKCSLWVHESAGTLQTQDMLLGMEWMSRENPKICFKPLSMKVRGHELTVQSAPHSYCDGHGYNCPEQGGGLKRPPRRGRSRDDILRDLLGNLRSGGGHGGGYGDGYGMWAGRGFEGPSIPVFKHTETRNDGHLSCQLAAGVGKQDEKAWLDWREIFPDRTWYDPDSNINSQGSMIFDAPTKRSHESSRQSDTKDRVVEWLTKDIHEHESTNIDERSSRHHAFDKASKDHPARLTPYRVSGKTPAKNAGIGSPSDAIRDKSQFLPRAPQHTWLDEKTMDLNTVSKNNIRDCSPTMQTKKQPETYALFR